MIRVYFVLNQFPVASETFVVNQVVAAITAGYSVKILTREIRDTNCSSQQELIHKHDLMSRVCCIKENGPQKTGSRVKKALGFLIRNPALWRVFLRAFFFHESGKRRFGLGLWFRIAAFLPFRDADIYHAQFGENGRFIAVMKSLGVMKGELLTTFHGYDAHFQAESLERQRKHYALLFAIGKRFSVNSDYIRRKLLALGCDGEKIMRLPMGVDVNFFCPTEVVGRGGEVIRLLSVGRLTRLKGHSLAIECVSRLLDGKWRVTYDIIGDGVERKELQDLIDRSGLSGRVCIHGFLSQSEVRDFMGKSDIFLMPSICDEKGRREAQGMVTAEAQAMMLPVVAFDSGGVKDTLIENETGLLAREADIEDFTSKVEFLIRHPEKRISMGTRGRRHVIDHFSLERMRAALIAFYEAVVT